MIEDGQEINKTQIVGRSSRGTSQIRQRRIADSRRAIAPRAVEKQADRSAGPDRSGKRNGSARPERRRGWLIDRRNDNHLRSFVVFGRTESGGGSRSSGVQGRIDGDQKPRNDRRQSLPQRTRSGPAAGAPGFERRGGAAQRESRAKAPV